MIISEKKYRFQPSEHYKPSELLFSYKKQRSVVNRVLTNATMTAETGALGKKFTEKNG
jgi:hypothetical protein